MYTCLIFRTKFSLAGLLYIASRFIFCIEIGTLSSFYIFGIKRNLRYEEEIVLLRVLLRQCDSKKFIRIITIFLKGNLAYGKQTDQVNTHNVGSSGRVVDGDSSTNYFSADSTCSHTMKGTSNPWWRVDLGRMEPVTEVYIVNRGDCCGARLSSFEIRVGKSQMI